MSTKIDEVQSLIALLRVVEEGTVQDVEKVLNSGISANSFDPTHHHPSPLKRAIDRGAVDIVNLLLTRGASNRFNPDISVPSEFVHACEKGNLEIVIALYKKFEDGIDPKEASDALWKASSENRSTVVKFLLTNKKFVEIINVPYWLDCTPLTAAAISDSHLEVMEELLAKGASILVEPTPLYMACSTENQNRYKVVSRLLKHPDCNKILNLPCLTAGRITPLMNAIIHGNIPMVALLLPELVAQKADLNLADKWGNTALSLAQEKGLGPIVKMLLDAGAVAKTTVRREEKEDVEMSVLKETANPDGTTSKALVYQFETQKGTGDSDFLKQIAGIQPHIPSLRLLDALNMV